MDFVASIASIGAIRGANNSNLLGSVVGVRGAGGGAGREDLRAVVHEGEEVFVDGGESDQPDVGDRELGRGTSCGEHGLERECSMLVFAGDGALLGAVCYALSALVRWRSPSGVVEAGFLLVLCST